MHATLARPAGYVSHIPMRSDESMSLPALLGGVPVADAGTYPSWPQWSEREREELLATLDSGAWWTGDGERAFRFARDFAQYQGAAAGYPFTNGTQTLEGARVACGVGEGDEVIVPGMTFVASASAVLAVNATPVIVDVDPEKLCIDPAAAEAAVGERIRASIVQHVRGARARAARVDSRAGGRARVRSPLARAARRVWRPASDGGLAARERLAVARAW